MNVNKLLNGQKLLVLRYAPKYKHDIIEQHQKLIKKLGYCWYGKLSGASSKKTIDELMNAPTPMILLYTKGKAYLCILDGYSIDKPIDGYPSYYDEEYLFPCCFYKFISIEEVNLSILDNLLVDRSGRKLSDVFSKQCMASSLLVSYHLHD